MLPTTSWVNWSSISGPANTKQWLTDCKNENHHTITYPITISSDLADNHRGISVPASCKFSLPLVRDLLADSLLFFPKVELGVTEAVLCIRGPPQCWASKGVLEDIALQWVCLGYQSQRLWSATIIWSSAISPGSIHNQAVQMRKTFSTAGSPGPAHIMGHLNKRFPIWGGFLYS